MFQYFYSRSASVVIRIGALTFAICLFVTAVKPSLATAELIEIPIASQAQSSLSIPRPERGASTVSVESEYGAPVSKTPTVGDPPISRWDYPDFYVYFEYEHVIHTVLKHQPKNL